MRTPVDREEGVKTLAGTFFIIPACFADTLYGLCLSINCKLLFVLYDLSTEYNMGWY